MARPLLTARTLARLRGIWRRAALDACYLLEPRYVTLYDNGKLPDPAGPLAHGPYACLRYSEAGRESQGESLLIRHNGTYTFEVDLAAPRPGDDWQILYRGAIFAIVFNPLPDAYTVAHTLGANDTTQNAPSIP